MSTRERERRNFSSSHCNNSYRREKKTKNVHLVWYRSISHVKRGAQKYIYIRGKRKKNERYKVYAKKKAKESEAHKSGG